MLKVSNKVPGAITSAMVDRFRKHFVSDARNRVAMNALTRTNIEQVAQDRDVLNDFDFVFSNEIEVGGPPQDQERAGTCWLFADVNWIRWHVARKLNCKTFTFSQNFHEFFDKLEKANYFLEKMIEYRKRDLLDRHLVQLLKNPVSDGGDWLYTVNCIKKYGLVPQSVMPDTFNLKNTRWMNKQLAYKCRQGAMTIREMAKQGKTVAQLRKAKEEFLAEIYNLLGMFLGLPPTKFSWAYWDDGPDKKKKGGKKASKKKGSKKDGKKFHRFTDMTPRAFTDRFLKLNPDDYVTLLNLPAEGYDFKQTYIVELGQNTVGASDMVFLNMDMPVLKDAAIKSIKAGDPILYASDAGPGRDTKAGYYHHALFDYENLLNMSFPMDKGQRVAYFDTQCNHLQLFIGVDLVKGKPVKWKIENSWGKQFGKEGIFMMSDGWFDEYVFTVLAHKKYVPASVLKLFKKKPKLIPLGGPFA